jgi:hypothetical protein
MLQTPAWKKKKNITITNVIEHRMLESLYVLIILKKLI